jgi:hypothetical protein
LKGSTNVVKGNVFEYYSKSVLNTQISKTCGELEQYALATYKIGTDIQYLIHHKNKIKTH